MNAAARRRRGTASRSLEIVLESPALNRSASLGVHEAVTLTQRELRVGRSDRIVARLERSSNHWHLDLTRSEELGIEAGPWERIGLRTPTGHTVLWIVNAT